MAYLCIDGTTHIFKINYSDITYMNNGPCITTRTFISGGYQWAFNIFLKDCITKEKGRHDFASIYVHLLDDCNGVKVSYSVSIKAREGTQGTWWHKKFDGTFENSKKTWGNPYFIEMTELEEKYVTDGFFVILFTINMNDDSPPECYCGAREEMSKLLASGDMADVKFEVDGEVLCAHKVILGSRSPVFKAELFGSMCETTMDCIKVKDMNPEVFKALLQFIYTYSLPSDMDANMIQHLLVAADRYAVEGLIMRCEERLIDEISLGTVLGFLSCAERHNFKKLKDACLEMVTQQKNFIALALTEEYFVIMQEFPSLVKDLRKRMIGS